MQTIVGVRFKKAGKIYYFDPGTLELRKEDPVIVETARGLEYGHVVIPARQLEDAEVATPLMKVRSTIFTGSFMGFLLGCGLKKGRDVAALPLAHVQVYRAVERR